MWFSIFILDDTRTQEAILQNNKKNSANICNKVKLFYIFCRYILWHSIYPVLSFESVLSVNSCFSPKACSTPILKLDKPCLIDDPVKSNESIKVNQVKSVSNSSISIIRKQKFRTSLMNYQSIKSKG